MRNSRPRKGTETVSDNAQYAPPAILRNSRPRKGTETVALDAPLYPVALIEK